MKTVLIAHNYSVTTFSAMSYYFAHHLADTGHKVVFISHKPFFSEKQIVKTEKGEIHLYSWSTEKRPTSIADFIWFSKIFREHKPDIVIGHFVGTNISFIVSKLLSFWKVRTYEHYHTLSDQILTDLKKMTLKQRLLFFRRKLFYPIFCDQIICTSQLGKEDLESFFGAKNSFVLLGPMVDRFESKKPISSDSIIISFLGRLDPSKGVIDLIRAFFKYKQKNPSSKISINIAGSGRLEAEIKELVKDNDSINFVGPLTYDKVDDYFNQSHFSIIPSKIDNLPTVGLESLMNQTPILISNNTGLTQYLVDGKDCFKFDANVDAMISLLEKVETKFEDSYAQMSIEARKTFMAKFSVKTYCEDFSKAIL